MDTATFEWYIGEQLAPTLRPGQVVVLDNLSAHKADRIRQAIEARDCQLLFLPPYSPDFTPIEQAFSKIKAILRGLGARTKEALQEAVRLAIEAITPHDARPGSPMPATSCLLNLPESCSRETTPGYVDGALDRDRFDLGLGRLDDFLWQGGKELSGRRVVEDLKYAVILV